jgi:hypothetical protein
MARSSRSGRVIADSTHLSCVVRGSACLREAVLMWRMGWLHFVCRSRTVQGRAMAAPRDCMVQGWPDWTAKAQLPQSHPYSSEVLLQTAAPCTRRAWAARVRAWPARGARRFVCLLAGGWCHHRRLVAVDWTRGTEERARWACLAPGPVTTQTSSAPMPARHYRMRTAAAAWSRLPVAAQVWDGRGSRAHQ